MKLTSLFISLRFFVVAVSAASAFSFGGVFAQGQPPRIAVSGPIAPELPPNDRVRASLFTAGIEHPAGLTSDRDGNVLIANYRRSGALGRIESSGGASLLCQIHSAKPDDPVSPRIGGVTLDREGRAIVIDSGTGRLLRVAMDGKRIEELADRALGVRFASLRDVTVDRHGNIYFTDAGMTGAESRGTVYRYDINVQKVAQIADGLLEPHGVAVAPDGESLCVAESGRRRIVVVENAAKSDPDVQRGPPKLLIDFTASESGDKNARPVGLAFDSAGRLFVATAGAGEVRVVSWPDGTLLRQYPAGGAEPTACHFLGESLLVTNADKEAVFRLPVEVAGFDYSATTAPAPSLPPSSSRNGRDNR